MITEEIRKRLIATGTELAQAESELSRPQEDVVTLSACQSVRDSMRQMMSLYLSAHAFPVNELMSLKDLLDKCARSNIQFSGVDMNNIECRGLDHEHCEGKYCLSIENVTGCLTTARKLKNIVWNELNL